MALEVINDGTAHPTRMEAVLRYCLMQKTPQSISELGNAVMPDTPHKERKILEDVLKHMEGMKLVRKRNNKIEVLTKNPPDDVRLEIKNRIFQSEGGHNALFARYYAWLLHHSGQNKDKNFDTTSPREKAAEYNREMSAESAERQFNHSPKDRNFKNWAIYLGLGHNIGGTAVFVPMPTQAIEESLPQIFKKKTDLPPKNFLKALAEVAPFLDGGKIYLEVSKMLGKSEKSETVSPAVSAALRILHDESHIELVGTTDAPKQFRLFPDGSHQISGPINVIRLLT